MILEAKNLSFRYEESGRKILDQFSLQVDSSERVGILAPSGFGKTTLCKILAGYEEPETGTVLMDGKSLYSYKGYCPVQMIWQHPEQALNPRWRMRQVLSEGGQVDEESRGRLGIREEWLDRFPSELSGGELQRFCIARALAANPRYLLADEITAMFDAVTQSQIWQALLHEAKGRELGMVIVSHSESLLKRICTRQIDLKALQEKKIAQIADTIFHRGENGNRVKLVLIAGPSSSGKTTFSHRLSVQLPANGLRPHPITVDNYFKEREATPRDENGDYDFESLRAVDVELFNRQMNELLEGKEVVLPSFNFITGHKEYTSRPKKLGKDDVLVIEGIHCLNPELTRNLSDENKFKVYISALTQLNIDEHNRIPTTDGRLLRRIVRDARTRGATAQRTIEMWTSVRRGEEANIFPYQEEADVMFNSALIYELAVLKPYVEAELFGISKDSPEYVEAKRLLKFLDYFVGISSENVPANSLLREFIGGGCFKV